MFFPLDLSPSSSEFSPAGTQPVSSCCCRIPVVPSLLFGANLHSLTSPAIPNASSASSGSVLRHVVTSFLQEQTCNQKCCQVMSPKSDDDSGFLFSTTTWVNASSPCCSTDISGS